MIIARALKVDAADEITLQRLRHLLPRAVFVSARTGEGIDELRTVVAEALPDPAMRIEVLVPFDRGDLVSRVHAEGTVLTEEFTGDGTLLQAKVYPALAGLLQDFRVAIPST